MTLASVEFPGQVLIEEVERFGIETAELARLGLGRPPSHALVGITAGDEDAGDGRLRVPDYFLHDPLQGQGLFEIGRIIVRPNGGKQHQGRE